MHTHTRSARADWAQVWFCYISRYARMHAHTWSVRADWAERVNIGGIQILAIHTICIL